jgi:hypothetical protein
MMKKILACCLTFGLLAGAGVAMGADVKTKAKAEEVEKVGVIEIVKADAAKKEKYDTVLLTVGEETFKLIPSKDKKAFKLLESLGGKQVTVKGKLMPAKPPKYPLAAILVESFEETEAAAPAAAPAPKKK